MKRVFIKDSDESLPRGEKSVKRTVSLLFVLLVILFAFFSIFAKYFLTSSSIVSMGFLMPEMGLMGLGMALSLMLNGVNLSINDGANLSALISGLFLLHLAHSICGTHIILSIALAVIVAVGVGIACGLLNALLIEYVRVQPILATLTSMMIFRGMSKAITGGKALVNFPSPFLVIGNGTLAGVPFPFLIFVVVVVLVYILLEYTPFGFKIKMVGTSSVVARFSGINVRSVITRTYVLSNVLGAIAGIIVMSRTNSVSYEYGSATYILLALLISVLAGSRAGFGSAWGVLIATAIFQILSSGFQMLLSGMWGNSFFSDFFWGILFIVVLGIGSRLTRLSR